MHISKKFALKKTRLHSDDTYDSYGNTIKAYAPKGTIYYQLTNGTIGRNARSYNMSEQAMTNLINSTPWAWSKGQCVELTPDTSNVVELKPKVSEDDYLDCIPF